MKDKTSCLEASRSPAAESDSGPEYGTSHVRVDHELERSIALSHVPESASSKPSEKYSHDIAYVMELLDFLDIECAPVSVYRMGRLMQNRPRLIKVVLPSSKHQRLAIRRTPRLCFSLTQKGVYLRPSLTWEERVRRAAHGR